MRVKIPVYEMSFVLALFSLFGCGEDAPLSTGDGDGVRTTDMSDDTERLQPDVQLDGEAIGDGRADWTEADGVIFEDMNTGEVSAADVEQEVDLTSGQGCLDLTDCADPDCVGICETCNDLIDNNDNGLVDCGDFICTDHIVCTEACGNGVDDDVDSLVDCEDPECALNPRCTEAVQPSSTYGFSDELSYIYQFQFPPAGVSCCADFDGDLLDDNQLLSVLSLIPNYDAQQEMNSVINGGELVVLLEWMSRPSPLSLGGTVDFNIFRGYPFSPDPEESTSLLLGDSPWADGSGLFQVSKDSFDELGPIMRLREADFGDNILTGGPVILDMSFPLGALDLNLDIHLYDVQFEIFMDEETDSAGVGQLVSVPQFATGIEGEVVVGGGELSGYVLADDVLSLFNEGASGCDCVEPSSSTPLPLLFDYGERPAVSGDIEYALNCQWSPLSEGDPGYRCVDGVDSPMCPLLSELCLFFPLLPLMLDIDSNMNGTNESLSSGLFFDIVSAGLAEPPVGE